jgi:hypothetical protein
VRKGEIESPIPLKRCPFCAGRGVLMRDGGSYGYYGPTVWVECENALFPEKLGDPEVSCAARTRKEQCERWEQGKGHLSVEREAIEKVCSAWNRRVEPESRKRYRAPRRA